ncbi:MAG: hypothetical protein GWO85_00325 [Simkaniaceae bacterium]|nr:hypothetical protein [Simkaniaceae bacterium]
MIRFFIAIAFIFSVISAQNYTLSIWGIPCGKIAMDYNHKDSLTFTTKSTGLIDVFWSFNNVYETVFDSSSFGFTFYKKRIRQKNLEQKLKLQWDKSSQSYGFNKNDTLHRKSPMQNIFTSLAKVQSLTPDELDAKWFSLDHEGQQVKARFLWAGSNNVYSQGDSIRCNHYRLDLIPTGQEQKILDRSDYFMEYIIEPDIIRQLWVEQKTPGRIIKVSVSRGIFKLEAFIDE